MEDNNYSKLKGKLFIPIAHTGKANIYKYNNVVIKKYHKDTSEYIRLDLEMFEKLKSIKSKALIHLIDCSYSKALEHPKRDYRIESFSYDYIKRAKFKSIDVSTEYTLNSLYKLRNLVAQLSELGIGLYDCFYGNTIVTDSNMVLIDPDQFFFHNNVGDNYKSNIEAINNMLLSLWNHEYTNFLHPFYDIRDYFTFNDFFKTNYDTYLNDMKNLLDEETPRDFLKKVLKERNYNYGSYEKKIKS